MAPACCSLSTRSGTGRSRLLHGMGVWMVSTIGEPPPDINAKVLVRALDPNLTPDPESDLDTDAGYTRMQTFTRT